MTVLLLGLGRAGFAQATTGSISGVALDESNSVLPGVSIEVRNVDTGVARSLITDEAGRYRALNLPPGPYRVRAELSGFRTVETAAIVVQIGRDVPVDLTLGVGQIAESVTVTGESTLVDLGAAVIGGVVTTQQIAELPLNGRSFMQLATLQPGVTVSRTTGRDFTGGFGGTQISIAGARPEQTGYLLEVPTSPTSRTRRLRVLPASCWASTPFRNSASRRTATAPNSAARRAASSAR